jgi:hypothetical protein
MLNFKTGGLSFRGILMTLVGLHLGVNFDITFGRVILGALQSGM